MNVFHRLFWTNWKNPIIPAKSCFWRHHFGSIGMSCYLWNPKLKTTIPPGLSRLQDSGNAAIPLVPQSTGSSTSEETWSQSWTTRFWRNSTLAIGEPEQRNVPSLLSIFKKYKTRAVFTKSLCKHSPAAHKLSSSPKLPLVFASGYVNTASVLYFFYKIYDKVLAVFT